MFFAVEDRPLVVTDTVEVGLSGVVVPLFSSTPTYVACPILNLKDCMPWRNLSIHLQIKFLQLRMIIVRIITQTERNYRWYTPRYIYLYYSRPKASRPDSPGSYCFPTCVNRIRRREPCCGSNLSFTKRSKLWNSELHTSWRRELTLDRMFVHFTFYFKKRAAPLTLLMVELCLFEFCAFALAKCQIVKVCRHTSLVRTYQGVVRDARDGFTSRKCAIYLPCHKPRHVFWQAWDHRISSFRPPSPRRRTRTQACTVALSTKSTQRRNDHLRELTWPLTKTPGCPFPGLCRLWSYTRPYLAGYTAQHFDTTIQLDSGSFTSMNR